MKTLLSFLFLFVMMVAFAQSDDKGHVYFIRSTGVQGSAVAFTAFIDDVLVCKLNNKRYSIHDVVPGKHRFTVQFGGGQSKDKAKTEAIEIDVEAGKDYYVQMIFQTGAFANNLYPQEVTANSAKKVMEQCRGKDECL